MADGAGLPSSSLSSPPQTSGDKVGEYGSSPRNGPAGGSDGTPRDVTWETPRELSEAELIQMENDTGLRTQLTNAGEGDAPVGVTEDGEQIFFADGAPITAEENAFFDRVEAIMSKARNGRYDEVEAALNNSFPVDSRDRYGNTLLMVCAQNGNKKMAKLVLRHGADMNAQNNRGQAALHYCFAYGYHALGEYLISKGCEPTIRNNDGLTCYDGLGRRNSTDPTNGA